jgi:prevent-host-death family protein
MVLVGIKELKAKLSSYIDKVATGEPVVITEHGREVAMIVQISRERKIIKSLIESGLTNWAGGKPKGLRGIKIKGEPLSQTILQERI